MRDTSFDTACHSLPMPIRALRSLTIRQASAIEAGVPSGWEVDRHESYDGHLSLVITPRLDGDVAYMVDGDGRAVRLGRLCRDVHDVLGSFAGPDQLLGALARLLVAEPRAA